MSSPFSSAHHVADSSRDATCYASNVRPMISAVKTPRIDSTPGSNPRWKHLVAGGIGGMIGATLTCPLEVVKTRLQSKALAAEGDMLTIARSIARAEGFLGFWKGLGPMLVGVVPARAVYFATYDFSKGYMNAHRAEDMVTHLVSAMVAGATTNFMINPVWVVKTRMQLQQSVSVVGAGSAAAVVGGSGSNSGGYRNSLHAVCSIMREDGVRGFYRGLVPSLWGISEGALQFMLYEDFKRRALASRRRDGSVEQLDSMELLAMAGVSKLLACVATYPHEVIRTRMRERGADLMYTSAVHCLKRVWLEEGRRGLYGGMLVHLIRVVPNTAVLFLTYETVSRWLA